MSYLFIRLACAFLVGSLLSLTGSLVQLSTRNVLSSPSTLGLDGLSVLALLLFHTVGVALDWYPGHWLLILGLPLILILGLSYPSFVTREGKFERVLLIGITMNLFVGALFSLWQFLFMAFNYPFPSEMWFGHFRFAGLEAFAILLMLQVTGLFLLRHKFSSLMLFSFGPQVARNWGLDTKSLFRFIFVFSAVVTFIIISLFGAFSFLALLFPIMARKIWFKKFDLRGELGFGPIMNGLFLMLMDWACFEFPLMGAEIPVGLVISAFGAVSLVALIWHEQGHKHSENLAKPHK